MVFCKGATGEQKVAVEVTLPNDMFISLQELCDQIGNALFPVPEKGTIYINFKCLKDEKGDVLKVDLKNRLTIADANKLFEAWKDLRILNCEYWDQKDAYAPNEESIVFFSDFLSVTEYEPYKKITDVWDEKWQPYATFDGNKYDNLGDQLAVHDRHVPIIKSKIFNKEWIAIDEYRSEINVEELDELYPEKIFIRRSDAIRYVENIGLSVSTSSVDKKEKPQTIRTLESKKNEVLGVHQETSLQVFDDAAEEFKQWLIMDTWPDEGAMWLMAGVIPREIYEGMGFFTTDYRLLHNDEGEKDEKLHVIGNLIRLWQSNPENPKRAKPTVFLNWAAEKNISISWLDNARSAGYLIDPKPKMANEEKPLGNRERETLLAIIAALCKEAKIPYDKPAKAAGMIQNTAATMGISIGETTIEGHLKKIPNALAGRLK